MTPATTSVSVAIAVHRHHWITSRYMVEACNTMGCTASVAVDTASGMLRTIGYGKASNSQGGDWFGAAVAVSADGNTLRVVADALLPAWNHMVLPNLNWQKGEVIS